jgi:hypothetical protein
MFYDKISICPTALIVAHRKGISRAGQGISRTDFAPCRFIFKNQKFNLDKAVPDG